MMNHTSPHIRCSLHAAAFFFLTHRHVSKSSFSYFPFYFPLPPPFPSLPFPPPFPSPFPFPPPFPSPLPFPPPFPSPFLLSFLSLLIFPPLDFFFLYISDSIQRWEGACHMHSSPDRFQIGPGLLPLPSLLSTSSFSIIFFFSSSSLFINSSTSQSEGGSVSSVSEDSSSSSMESSWAESLAYQKSLPTRFNNIHLSKEWKKTKKEWTPIILWSKDLHQAVPSWPAFAQPFIRRLATGWRCHCEKGRC